MGPALFYCPTRLAFVMCLLNTFYLFQSSQLQRENKLSPDAVSEHLHHVQHSLGVIHRGLQLLHGRQDPSPVDELADEVLDARRAHQVGQGAHLRLRQEPEKEEGTQFSTICNQGAVGYTTTSLI